VLWWLGGGRGEERRGWPGHVGTYRNRPPQPSVGTLSRAHRHSATHGEWCRDGLCVCGVCVVVVGLAGGRRGGVQERSRGGQRPGHFSPLARASTTPTHVHAMRAGRGAAEMCRGAWRGPEGGVWGLGGACGVG